MSSNIEFISAGAGSGKTYSLIERLKTELTAGDVQPAGVIATTFTRRAASELQERVREALMDAEMIPLANQMSQALISTVNGVCGLLLERFSFEAGYSPDLNVLDEMQEKRLFHEAVDHVLGDEVAKIKKLNALSRRLGIEDKGQPQWREQLADLVSAARANNCVPTALPEFAKHSSDELLLHFRAPVDRDLDAQLCASAQQALKEMADIADSTKATKTYVQLLRRAIQSASTGNLSWPEWIGLSKKLPGAKSRDAALPVQIVASDYEVHPRLQSDIREYTTLLFEIAAECLEAYQQIKQRQGLIDFVDQELLVYQLLEHPNVKAALSDELQLLMVDEFQDTSPIQLALFSRLAALADKVIWVGDIKQAIYGFRGSDPELMQAVVDQVKAQGGSTQVLENSWRSRPALVKYCNAIFTGAFANSLSEEKVALNPKREELLPASPAVIQLQLTGKKDAQQAVLAASIRNLVESGHQIIDKESKQPRPVRYGDIAVLCRSNNRLSALASACAAKGVAVGYQRPGLLATPECILALSCLRRVLDKHDTLATAQVRSLIRSESAEAWLGERLNYLQSDMPSSAWGEDGENSMPELRALASLRTRSGCLTPSEALGDALACAKVREAVVRWGPTAQRARARLANLDSLLAFSSEYESACQLKHVAATITGLLQWFDELSDRGEDSQAVMADDETVQLLTYHRSKGLEWPVVYCHDLDVEPRSRLWGLSAMSTGDKVDVDDPLAGRALRFFPAFFGANKKDVTVKDRVEAAEVGLAATLSAIEEEKRLYYVAFTRARDLIVLPTAGKTPSLDSVLNAAWLLPEETLLSLPDGVDIPTQCIEGTDSEFFIAGSFEPRYFASTLYECEVLPRSVSPSAMPGQQDAKVAEVIELGDRIALKSGVDMASLGSAFHAILAADINYRDGLTIEQAERILARFDVGGAAGALDVLSAGRGLIKQLEEDYEIVAIYPEFPIQSENEQGQQISGFIDLLVETSEGFLIIDHKSAPGGHAQWPELASRYAGQLQCYRAAIERHASRPVLGCWIHLIIGGALLQVA